MEPVRAISKAGAAFMRASTLAVALATTVAAAMVSASSSANALVPFSIVGDGIPHALTATEGDPARGRAIVTNRTIGLCLLCHPASFADATATGNLAPSLDGAGGRLTAAQLRLRIVDSRRNNASSIMPSYYRVEAMTRTSQATQNKPIFDAQQIEDVVAFLSTLK